MNRKKTRLQAKTAARVSLAGSWMKGSVLVAISILLGMFCSNFIPIYAPAQPLTTQQLTNMNAAQMLTVFADMLVPEVITKNYIARVLISFALYLLIIPPFQQGMKQFFIKVLQGEKPKISVAFMWYANLTRVFGSIALYFYVALLSMLWFILIFALPIAALAVSRIYFITPLVFVGFLLYFAALVLFAMKLMSYLPAFYLYAHNPGAGVRSAVRTSVAITRGRLMECLIFQLSFILWNLSLEYIQIYQEITWIFIKPWKIIFLLRSNYFIDASTQ